MNNIINIYKKEMREIIRDKKSLAMMFIIPIMIPLIVLGISYLFEDQINSDVKEFNKIGITYELNDAEKEIAKETDIEFINGDLKELEKKYDSQEIYAYITLKDNKYTIYYDEKADKSSMAYSLIMTYLETYKVVLQNDYLAKTNIDSKEILDIIEIETKNLEKDNFFADYIIGYAFIFVITAITTAAIYPSTDTTAGEKERGTLETLLTFPIKNKDLIIGKYLAVVSSSFIAGILSLILALASLFIAQNSYSIYESANLMLSFKNILIITIIIIAYSLFISGISIAISSRCKSFKEAQSALTPITFVAMFPSIILFMLNIKTTALLSVIPFVNYNLIINDLIAGNTNYIYILLMFVSTIIYISLIIYYIIKQYKSEKILFNN